MPKFHSEKVIDLPSLTAIRGATAMQADPIYHQGFFDAQEGVPFFEDAPVYAAGWRAFYRAKEIFEREMRPAEDLTPEGIQLVIPGAERVAPPSQKQMDLF